MVTPVQMILLGQSGLLVYLLPLAGSMLLIYGIFQVVMDSQNNTRKRITDRLQERRPSKVEKKASIARRGALGEEKSVADAIFGKFSFIPRLQTTIDQADLGWNASQMLANLAAAGMVVSVVMIMAKMNMIVSALCGFGVILLPIVWLNFRRNSRMAKLETQLPDVFEMMSQALRAGQSLAGSIQVVYEQMPNPIAKEFAMVYHEQNLGIKIEEALEAMANRVDSLDVRFFVTAVNIQRSTGGDLAEVLDNISGVIRERIELKGLVKGLTAEGRLSGWVLFALPAVVFAGSIAMNPDYGNTLLEDPTGQIMLMIAGGLQLMGIAMIRWIVNIKV